MQQRVRRQCCTRGRFRPAAHPRRLAGVLMPEPSARRFLCACCRTPVLVCSHCDRGQIYCASGCAATARSERQREAAQRYQCSRRGRFKHAARTRRWRERQAVLARLAATTSAQSVTHQGCAPAAWAAVLATNPSLMPGAAGPSTPPCMTLSATEASRTSTPATPGSGELAPTSTGTPAIAPPAWACAWCHRACAPRLRLNFLRHSPAPRSVISRREQPSHGHSP